ncbi:MAG: hypothetical protein R3C97_17915 [Geminicoccaceae bacterium]
MPARGEHPLGLGQRRLFDESTDFVHTPVTGNRRTRGNITEACLGPCRSDAEGDDLAGGGMREAEFHGLEQSFGRKYEMVRRTDEDHRLLAERGECLEGGEGDGSGRVPRRRLEQDMAGCGRIERAQLPTDKRRLTRRRHDDEAVVAGEFAKPCRCLLQHRTCSGELGQVFGKGRTAHGPEAGAGTAGENHGHDHISKGNTVSH